MLVHNRFLSLLIYFPNGIDRIADQWYNNDIKNSCNADTLDGCLHFISNFSHRAERTLTPGDLNNQNLNRRSSVQQRAFAQPHTCTLKISYYPEEPKLLSRKHKPENNSNIPQHIIESIARCILPDIIAYYETVEGQQQFEEWKAMQEAQQTKGKEDNLN